MCNIRAETKSLEWLFEAGGAALEAWLFTLKGFLFCSVYSHNKQTRPRRSCEVQTCAGASVATHPSTLFPIMRMKNSVPGGKMGVTFSEIVCFRWWHKIMIEILGSYLSFSKVVIRMNNREETDGLLVLPVSIQRILGLDVTFFSSGFLHDATILQFNTCDYTDSKLNRWPKKSAASRK